MFDTHKTRMNASRGEETTTILSRFDGIQTDGRLELLYHYRAIKFAVSKVIASVWSAVFRPRHRPTRSLPCRWYIVRSQSRPPPFHVCHVATVVMETAQLVL